jgi:hypothetical protein
MWLNSAKWIIFCGYEEEVSALKIVDLPTLGNPIIPQVKDIILYN